MSELVITLIVPPDHPSLPGHFPGRPIVPGVLLLDLIAEQFAVSQPNIERLIGIPSAKFQRPVLPNETVTVSMRIVPSEDPKSLRARFQATVNGRSAAEGTFVFAVG